MIRKQSFYIRSHKGPRGGEEAAVSEAEQTVGYISVNTMKLNFLNMHPLNLSSVDRLKTRINPIYTFISPINALVKTCHVQVSF